MKLPGLKNAVVYLCNEFAIDNELPTYSGGLGILAGDLMLEAGIEHFPLIGIGLLYKGKQFLQHITHDAKAVTKDSEFDHDTSFLRQTTQNGKPIELALNFESQTVKIKSYHIRLSDTTILFFLSTDIDGNPPEWISDMGALYHGDTESIIRQQVLLGIGSVKLLNAIEIEPRIYHINEGRPEFIIWQITADRMKEGKSFEESWQEAKEKIVYTNHTLVPAGNPTYPSYLVEKYASAFAREMNIEPRLLIKDGLQDENTFSTTLFALNISKRHSAVSKFHCEQAKNIWPKYDWIGITNGIHLPRWQDSDFRKENLTDEDIWNLHIIKKRELMETVVKRTGFGYDPQRLVITWARRLADYKQPRIIFSDLKRLKRILSNPEKPVQLLFAGNSHTADPNAKSIIEEIIRIFSTELSGYAIFVPNYNISLANHMVSGSDVWLNTPKGNQEACGTSGMKAIANGVLNCTVLDGWTFEVDWNGIGWILNSENVAESFYEILENEITTLYYQRDEKGIPREWLKRMRSSIELSKKFSCKRMLEEYRSLLYT